MSRPVRLVTRKRTRRECWELAQLNGFAGRYWVALSWLWRAVWGDE